MKSLSTIVKLLVVTMLITTVVSCKKEEPTPPPPAPQLTPIQKIVGTYSGRVRMEYFSYIDDVKFIVRQISDTKIEVMYVNSWEFVLENTYNIRESEYGKIKFTPDFREVRSFGIKYIYSSGSYCYYKEDTKEIYIKLQTQVENDDSQQYYILTGIKD